MRAKTLGKRLLMAMAGLLAAGLGGQAAATEPSGLRLSYDVSVAGIHSMETDLVIAMDADSYRVALHMEKDGLPAVFSPMFYLDATAHGSRSDDEFQPLRFRTEYRKEHKYRWSEILHRDGAAALAAEPHPVLEDEREAIDPELQSRSFDPLSSFAWMLARAEKRGDCTAEGLVFDGRRLYDMSMTHLPGKASDGSFFCEMKLGWLAGFTEKERRQAPYPDGLKFTLARAYDGGPIVPRLIEAKIGMGDVRAELVKVEALTAEQVAERLPSQ